MGVVSLATIREAARKMEGLVLKTPLHRVPIEAVGASRDKGEFVHLKMENLQLTGSFKLRGATNAVLNLEAPEKGVCAHSAGNHGAALAWAARNRGIGCTVVCPTTAPQAKKEAMRQLGATVLEVPHSERGGATAKVQRETGAAFVHPFDDEFVVNGQGTLGLELEGLDAVLVPVSGGGMAAGVRACLNELAPRCKVVLVEPKGKRLAERLRDGDRGADLPDATQPLDTIADGMRSRALGERPWSVLKDTPPEAVLSVSDHDVLHAMTVLFSHFKTCVEPSGATALAAIQATDTDTFRAAVGPEARAIGAIVCGGNLDIGPMLRAAYLPSS